MWLSRTEADDAIRTNACRRLIGRVCPSGAEDQRSFDKTVIVTAPMLGRPKMRLRCRCPIPPPSILAADDPWFVDHPRQIVEIDRADAADLIGDVAREHREIDLVDLVPRAQAAFRAAAGPEFQRIVEEIVDRAAIGPIGVEIHLRIGTHWHGVARRHIGDELGRLGQGASV